MQQDLTHSSPKGIVWLPPWCRVVPEAVRKVILRCSKLLTPNTNTTHDTELLSQCPAPCATNNRCFPPMLLNSHSLHSMLHSEKPVRVWPSHPEQGGVLTQQTKTHHPNAPVPLPTCSCGVGAPLCPALLASACLTASIRSAGRKWA
jgi:hypothetical protein